MQEVRFDMGFYDVLAEVSARSGVATTRIGPLMGRDRSYVSGAISRGSVPSVDNAAAMLAACGWSLVAVPSEDVPPSALVVAPPAPPEDVERLAMERERERLASRLAALDAALEG